MSTQKLMVLNQDESIGIRIQKEVDGLTMGILTDGEAYVSESSLAELCGVSQVVIDSIGQEWNAEPPTTRIAAIKMNLRAEGYTAPRAYVTAMWKGVKQRCYPSNICTSILNYFAFNAGPDCQETARESIRRINGTPTPGHDSPTGSDAMPPGFFDPDRMPFGLDLVELYRSIEQCWDQHWEAQKLGEKYGERSRNPEAESNPRAAQWFYPNASLAVFRAWVQHEYYAGGMFEAYLNEKVARGEIHPALAAHALTTILRGARMGSA